MEWVEGVTGGKMGAGILTMSDARSARALGAADAEAEPAPALGSCRSREL